jgi:O-antigen/teichoic acid export membrane protein
VIRNVVALLGTNVASWVVSLAFWLVVPRLIGPTGWGEWNLGNALSGVVFAVGGMGISTFLVKEIARDRRRAADYVGAGLTTHLILAAFAVVAVVLFCVVAGYNHHERVVILLVTVVAASAFVVTPAFYALQAMQRMKVAAVLNSGRQIAANLTVVLIALLAGLRVEVLVIVMLVCNVLASVTVYAVVARLVGINLKFNLGLSRWMVTGGLPFWSNTMLLTFYFWIDSVLLSLFVSTREVGYYAAPVQVLLTLGFLPAAIAFATFPAMSSSFHAGDLERVRQLTRTSLSVLLALGIPLSVGTALVGPSLVRHVFGPEFGPAAPAMVILAFTIVPGYVSILAFNVLASVDRQRQWAYVLGVTAVVNPLVNIVAIPWTQATFGHGTIGAALALLLTDGVMSVTGIALIQRQTLRPAGPLLVVVARTAIATAAMAVPVWLLRDRFPLVPVVVGALAFGAAALIVRLHRSEGFEETWDLVSRRLVRLFGGRPEAPVILAAADPPS